VPYIRAPHLLIGLPMRFAPIRKKDLSHSYPGLTDIGLLTSRDGKQFQLWGDSISRPRHPDQQRSPPQSLDKPKRDDATK
jgi:hypothetical protein